MKCPVCEIGDLHPKQDTIHMEYRGYSSKLVSYYEQCSKCSSEIVTSRTAKENKRVSSLYKKHIDTILCGDLENE